MQLITSFTSSPSITITITKIQIFVNNLILKFSYDSLKCSGKDFSKSQAIKAIILGCKNEKIQSLDFYKDRGGEYRRFKFSKTTKYFNK